MASGKDYGGLSEYDPATESELRKLRRREKMAEMLAAQALEPMQSQSAGRFVVPKSPWQGVAKMAQAFAANRSDKQNDAKYSEIANALAQQKNSATDAMIKGYSAGQYVNPDTGTAEVLANKPVMGAPVDPKAAMVPAPQAGGAEGALAAVQGLPQNKYTNDIRQALMLKQMEQDAERKTAAYKATLPEYGKNTPYPDDVQAQMLAIAKAKAEQTRLTNAERPVAPSETQRLLDEAFGPGDSPERRKGAQDLVQKRAGGGISNVDARAIEKSQVAATNGAQLKYMLENFRKTMAENQTSLTEPIIGSVGRGVSALGIGSDSMDKRAAAYEDLKAMTTDMGILKLTLIGGSDTEKELAESINTAPSADKTVEANNAIIERQLKAVEILEQYPDFQSAWLEKNGSLAALDKVTGEGMRAAWRKYQREMFSSDAPGAAPAPGATGAPIPVSKSRIIKIEP